MMMRHAYVRCCPRKKSYTRKIEGRRRAKIRSVRPLLERMKEAIMAIRKLPILLMEIEGAKTTAAVVVGKIIEEIDRMEEGVITMTGGETIVAGGIIMIVVVVMDVGGIIIGTAVGGEEAGEMTGGIMVEGGVSTRA